MCAFFCVVCTSYQGNSTGCHQLDCVLPKTCLIKSLVSVKDAGLPLTVTSEMYCRHR